MNIADLNVLVAEDDRSQREILAAILKRLEAKAIYTADDGQQALDLVVKHRVPIHVVISDVEMPSMDGLEFMRRLGQAGYKGSVIVVSGLDGPLLAAAEAMTTAYGINLLGVLNKPVDPAYLQELLKRDHVPQPDSTTSPDARSSFTLEEIIDALAENQVEPFFQPKVEIATRRVIGMEALARWRHPQQGIVLPAAFIKVLEDANRVDELTWVILRKGLAFCSKLNAAGVESSVAVNLSLKSLRNPELSARLAEIARAQNIDTKRICLEITETAATTNLAAALENLTRLRMKGFGLSIDDFGTGYSSMQQLGRIPFTELKIDRSFVANAPTQEAAKVILTSSLQIARKLNIKAVAEGVETQQEWDLLQELGCDLAQGYFVARPMPAGGYLKWMQELGSDATSIFTAP